MPQDMYILGVYATGCNLWQTRNKMSPNDLLSLPVYVHTNRLLDSQHGPNLTAVLFCQRKVAQESNKER